MQSPIPKLINEHAAAELLGLSVYTMRADRYTKKRFPFLKIGRSVRYDQDSLRALLAANVHGGGN